VVNVLTKVLTLFSIATAVSAADTSGVEHGLRIGVLTIENAGHSGRAADAVSDRVAALVAKNTQADIITQQRMEQLLAGLGEKMPVRCRDPRCVLSVGAALNLDRMVSGSVAVERGRSAVRLRLLDVGKRVTAAAASVDGERNVPLDSVLAVAVARLFAPSGGGRFSKETIVYPAHNVRQMLLATAACVGAALTWGCVNYSQGNKGALLAFEERDEPLSAIPSSADQVPMFARPAALANAYVAASDDAYGVLYNPAGVALVQAPEVILGYQYRFGLNNIAASYVNKATNCLGFGSAFLYSGDREGLMSETYFVSALACRINRLFATDLPVSLGINLKIASDRVQGSGPFSVSGSSFGAAFDLGFIAALSEKIRYGLLVRDLPIVNLWKNRSTGDRYNEALATTLHMGGSYRAGATTFLIAEGQVPIAAHQPWKMAGGIEQELFGVIMVRAGAQKVIQSYAGTPWKITAGFGLDIDDKRLLGRSICLDASYEYNTLGVFDVLNVSFKIGW
jgi:hypothetical protein